MLLGFCLLVSPALAHQVDEAELVLTPTVSDAGWHFEGALTIAWAQAFFVIEKTMGRQKVDSIKTGENFTDYISATLIKYQSELGREILSQVKVKTGTGDCALQMLIPPKQAEALVLGEGHIVINLSISCPGKGNLTVQNKLLIEDIPAHKNRVILRNGVGDLSFKETLLADKPEAIFTEDEIQAVMDNQDKIHKTTGWNKLEQITRWLAYWPKWLTTRLRVKMEYWLK